MPVPTHERKLSCRKPNIVVHLAHVTCNSIFENKKAPVCMSNTYTEATCFSYKSSAEAEMGDSLATIDMGEKRGCCAPFGRGVGSPSNTMWTEPRPISTPSFTIHQRHRQDRQRSDRMRQTILKMVVQKVCAELPCIKRMHCIQGQKQKWKYKFVVCITATG